MKIWVDDLREPDKSWKWAKTSEEAIRMLEWHKDYHWPVSEMSLDHDLGGNDDTRKVVTWMIHNNYWPGSVKVHTANPVGKEWLEGMIARYKP